MCHFKKSPPGGVTRGPSYEPLREIPPCSLTGALHARGLAAADPPHPDAGICGAIQDKVRYTLSCCGQAEDNRLRRSGPEALRNREMTREHPDARQAAQPQNTPRSHSRKTV